jgi:SAM-dependent methyltransferase
MIAPERGAGEKRQVEVKREFYRRPEVATDYDRQRFGGASGAYVNNRELRLAAALLPAGGVIADVGCGTGRLLPLLRRRAATAIGLDASLPMLTEARRRQAGELVQADAFQLPLRSGCCDAVASLRLLFHFDDPVPLLRELRRITRVGGTLVCDTSTWSPRALVPLGRGRWGDRVASVARGDFRALAAQAGWRVRAERACFFVSPYLYRKLPLRLAVTLQRIEPVLPESWLCRVVWALEAT